MTESAHQARRQARLAGIQLPRMDVENRWPVLAPVDPRDAPPGPAIWENPEVASPGNGEVQWAPSSCRCRRFDHYSPVPLQSIGVPGRQRDAVPIVMDRKDARIVGKALFDENVERPQRARRNRVAWRTISLHRGPAFRFQQPFRTAYIIA